MARLRQRLLCASLLSMLWLAAAQAAAPIRIGFSIALTGGLAGTGKAALLATQMWAEDVNAAGGLLGRPVELVYYDDQSSGATVPGIYTKLLDIDKVDLIVSGYATNMVAPAVPIAMQHGMVLMSLFGLAVNTQFQYDRYFQIVPSGDDPEREFSRGYLDLAMGMNPPPRTVAIVGADAQFGRIAMAGPREHAPKQGPQVGCVPRSPHGPVHFP